MDGASDHTANPARAGGTGAMLTQMTQLDSLRALAVFAVMFTHFVPNPGWLGVIPWARWGVQLFFVLSGFLISLILLRCRVEAAALKSTSGPLFRFYARRFLRIFPLFYFVVITGWILGVDGLKDDVLWHLTYTSNIRFALENQWGGSASHFWTLAVEEQFYLVWPLLILFLPYRVLPAAIAATFAAGLLFRAWGLLVGINPTALYVLPFAALDAFAVGSLLAYLSESPARYQARQLLLRISLWVGAPLMIVCVATLRNGPHAVWQIGLNTATALLSVALIGRAAAGFGGWTGKLLEWRPLVYCGRISYGMYVYHLFLLLIPVSYIPVFPFIPRSITRLIFLWTATVAVATVSWYLLERPMNNLKRYFPYGGRRKIPMDQRSVAMNETGRSPEPGN